MTPAGRPWLWVRGAGRDGGAKELAPDGIRVNAVAPGIVRTGIHGDAGDPDRPDRLAGRIPLGRAGEPGELAPAVAWLLGPEAAYVTGRRAPGRRRPLTPSMRGSRGGAVSLVRPGNPPRPRTRPALNCRAPDLTDPAEWKTISRYLSGGMKGELPWHSAPWSS